MASDIAQVLKRFEKGINDPEDRHRSWELCYEFFHEIRNAKIDEKLENLAALNLDFYLASWGMFHNSFLLQKSYLALGPVAKEILKKEYEILWELDDETIANGNLEEMWGEIEQLKKVIYQKLHPTAVKVMGIKTKQPTDTLITKIMLGTMGCVPAYDANFIHVLREMGPTQTFDRNSFEEVVAFYKEKKEQFKEIKFETAKNHLPYPPMKNLDLYFWAKGGGE
jgi:hypothetical protein